MSVNSILNIGIIIYLLVTSLIGGFMKYVMECESSLIWLMWPLLLGMLALISILTLFYKFCTWITHELDRVLGLNR